MSSSLTRLSRAVVGACALMIAVGVGGTLLTRTTDIDALSARLPLERHLSEVAAGFVALPFEILGSLDPGGRATAQRRAEERQARDAEVSMRDAATWRAFVDAPPGDELGARLVSICPAASPPDATQCISDARRQLDAVRMGREERRSQLTMLAALGALLLAAYGLGRAAYARRDVARSRG